LSLITRSVATGGAVDRYPFHVSLVYVAVYLLAATLIFQRRDIH